MQQSACADVWPGLQALGGPMSRKTYRFVRDTRSCTAFGVTVRPVRTVDGQFSRPLSGGENKPGAKKNGRHDEPVAVHNHQHFGIRRASARRWKKRWSDRGLQVERPEGRWCSIMFIRHRRSLHRVAAYHILAQRCMHHAPTRGCCRASLAVGE